MWRKRFQILPALCVLFAVGTVPLAAQYIPGGSHRENRARFDRRLAEYRSYALAGVTDAIEKWESAWEAGDLNALGDLYTENAVLSPPGGGSLARTGEEIEEFLGELVASTERLSVDVLDFEVDDMMAFVLGRFERRPESKGGVYSGTQRGLFMTVYEKEGDDWKIRSQLFRLDA